MSTLADWLEARGLGAHARVLEDNDVDLDIIVELDESDFEKLGLSLGARKRLLKATALLRGEDRPQERGEGLRESPAGSTTDVDAPDEAQRRQLTIMFCDLVGSTPLAELLDPEDLREIINAYHGVCARAVERFDGYVARYMGDGLLVYFGYPRAHEDDAERALRAGLDILEAIGPLDAAHEVELRERIGVATGRVVVGDIIGKDTAEQRAVIGETPNLAARLQGIAVPNTMVIGLGTHQLIGDAFECEPLGEHTIKGFREPTPLWRVASARRTESRFDAARGADLTPLVGRSQEIGLLMDRWRLAVEGDGQAVLLSGEPGIGKSRILEALCEGVRDSVAEQPGDVGFTRLFYQCSPYHSSTAFYPFLDHLERAARIDHNEPPATSLARIDSSLHGDDEVRARLVALIASLLAVPLAGPYEALALEPLAQKEALIEGLVGQALAMSVDRPLLLIFEDVHWIDPTSLELLTQVIDAAQSARLLVIVTFRPEFRPPWVGLGHLTSLTLNRFGAQAIATMIDRVTGHRRLPDEVARQIAAKTDGVPLFVEELTKTVLESGILRSEDNEYQLTGPLPPLAIPATLQDSLMARLEQHAPVKEVAQTGAAIGREFSPELLAAVLDISLDSVAAALEQLIASKLVVRRTTAAGVTYSFKHALVQDAAHESLLHSRRRQLHARIANVLEQRYPEKIDTQPALLALHLTEAGLDAKAVEYWQLAGQQALALSANVEAVDHLSRGMARLRTLPPEAPNRARELSMQLMLGEALRGAHGSGAIETGQAFEGARLLADELGDEPSVTRALYGEFASSFNGARLASAREVARDLLRLGDTTDDEARRVIGHQALGLACFVLGEPVTARAELERALASSVDRDDEALERAQFPSTAMVYLSWSLFVLGHVSRAVETCEASVRTAREESPFALAIALGNACSLHQFRLDREALQDTVSQLVALATEKSMPVWLGLGRFFQGWLDAGSSTTTEDLAGMADALRSVVDKGQMIDRPYLLGVLAEAHAHAGAPAQALTLLDEALGQAADTDERWFEPELLRIKGETLAAMRGPGDEAAEAALRSAGQAANAQGARLWELRAAVSRHALARRDEDKADTLSSLETICAALPDDELNGDLQRARRLLPGADG